MTPKEKAKEIYYKYADALNIRDLQITANPYAKQCALLAVDEIEWIVEDDEDKWNYWQQVKQEIQAL